MIWIKYPDNMKPPPEWLDRAQELTDQLKAAQDKATRDKTIDDNSDLWGEIKQWLESFSHGKCWFSEARDTYSYYHVEHYRPKKQAREPDRDGYWWLAFDYLNYRLCGGVGNVKKGSYFPLFAGTMAARCPEDNCDDEAPLLLDPIEAGDVMLLNFAEAGKAVPAEPDGWHNERAVKSIERYKLNDHPPLCRARAEIWSRCLLEVNELEVLLLNQKQKYSPSRERDIKAIVKRLSDRTRPDAEFSAVARAFLSQHPRAWAKRCVV